MRYWLSLLVALAACGDNVDSDCTISLATYRTVGEPYLDNWCRGCHGADIPDEMRQGAPLDVNFDTLADVHERLPDIRFQISSGAMPPEGGPSDADQATMESWLRCGAPP